MAGSHPGNASEQHPQAAVRLLEKMRSRLDRHPAGDFRHRREERQPSRRRRDGFIGDTNRAAGDQVARLLGIGRKVEVGEEDLARLEHLALESLGLLDLDDHFRVAENLRRSRDDGSARVAVRVIVHSDTLPGGRLDDHLVAVSAQFPHAGSRKANAMLEDLGLLGNADAHAIRAFA